MISRAFRCALAPMLTLVFVALLPPATTHEFSIVPQAQAHANDALVRKCRKAMFKRYGQRETRSGRRVRSISTKFSIAAVDACVANGGRLM
jgi:hypothetical protein